jgi:hypothetical protein
VNLPPYSVAQYVTELRARRSTGSATAETSFYPPLDRLLNSVGKLLSRSSFSQLNSAIREQEYPTVAFSLKRVAEAAMLNPRSFKTLNVA